MEVEVSALNVQTGGSHYKDCAIQPIEYIHANGLDFFQGNIIKYATRHKAKNGAEDLRKVIHYAQLALELQYGQAMGDEQPTDDPFPCIETECAINTRHGHVQRRQAGAPRDHRASGHLLKPGDGAACARGV